MFFTAVKNAKLDFMQSKKRPEMKKKKNFQNFYVEICLIFLIFRRNWHYTKSCYTKLVLYQIGIIPNHFIRNHVIPNHVW
jgi:hypothetical protein